MNEYQKQHPETIRNMFDQIARHYDLANGVMSMQMHKIWNRRLIQDVIQSQKPEVFLDLCCGTGEISLGYLKKETTPCQAFLLDFSSQMLDCAKHKAFRLSVDQHQINYIQADAQQIPLPDSFVNCATVAYGIRNVQDPLKCAKDVFRVLRPGGTFGILELTRPSNPIMKAGHQFYLKNILPLVGRWVSKNKEAYQYLCNSIDQFIAPDQMLQILNEAGFSSTECKPLFGGIATIFVAKK